MKGMALCRVDEVRESNRWSTSSVEARQKCGSAIHDIAPFNGNSLDAAAAGAAGLFYLIR
jgi:hypothetical protein